MLMIDDGTCNWAVRVILWGEPSLESILNTSLKQELLDVL
jgi:hypothetical protein